MPDATEIDVPPTTAPEFPTSLLPLDAWIGVGDPLADAVVPVLSEHGVSGPRTLPGIRALAAEGEEACAAFLAQIEAVPEWVDFDLVNRGGALFHRHLVGGTASLLLGTLLMTYMTPSGALSLVFTGRFERDVVRRVYETASMIDAVSAPDGLRPGGPGWQTMLRVRLLHAKLRGYFSRSGRWPAELGIPVHQLDLAYTSTTFGHTPLEGMRRLGVRVSGDDAAAHQHMWRYATYLNGVSPALLADSPEEEARYHALFRAELVRPTDDARRLADALFATVAQETHLPEGALRATARQILDPEIGDALGLRRTGAWRALVKGPVTWLMRAANVRALLPQLDPRRARIGRRVVHAFVARGLRGVAADYEVRIANRAKSVAPDAR